LTINCLNKGLRREAMRKFALFSCIFVLSCGSTPTTVDTYLVQTNDVTNGLDMEENDIENFDIFEEQAQPDMEEVGTEDVPAEDQQPVLDIQEDTVVPLIKVFVDSEPAAALVTVDEGTTQFFTPFSLHLQAGPHSFHFSKDGYQDQTLNVEISQTTDLVYAILQEEPLVLVPVVIDSVPQGASVSIDSEPNACTTPCMNVVLPEGMHQFSFTLEGYEPLTVDQEITEENFGVFVELTELLPGEYLVFIDSMPQDALVSINQDVDVCTTPCATNLVEGMHHFAFTLSGYETEELDDYISQTNTSVFVELTEIPPVMLSVDINSTPAGADVSVDGEYVCQTPCFNQPLEEGSHTLEFSLTGYNTAVVQHEFSEANDYIHVTLTELPTGEVEVDIDSEPHGASVSIDGEADACTTPCLQVMEVGEHQFEFTLDGYETETVSEDISETNNSVFVTLTELPPVEYSVVITSNPTGAAVAIDGQDVCTTPCVEVLTEGWYEFVFTLDGYSTETTQKYISETNTSIAVSLTELPPDEIEVNFDSEPEGASVSIDDSLDVCTTPCSHLLVEGEYTFSFTLDGYEPEIATNYISATNADVFVILTQLPPDEVMVTIDSEPQGASVAIDDTSDVCTTPCFQSLPIGPHEFVFTADGYEAETVSQDVSDINNSVFATLTELPPDEVLVSIDSEPPGASVAIDGTPDVCITPCSLSLTVGPHEFVFTLTGYESETVNDDISDINNNVSVTLTEIVETFSVTISSSPMGASVSIDGMPDVCSTPCSEQLTAGSHEFNFTLDGYQPETFNEEISALNTSIYVALTELPLDEVLVSIDSTPPGASVAIDGTPDVCTTPCSQSLTEGSHQFVFTLAGYEDEIVSEDISVSNDTVSVTLTQLPPDEVLVSIDSTPSGASVAIDGTPDVCTTPCSQSLTEGSHQFVFTLTGYEDETVSEDISVSNDTVFATLTEVVEQHFVTFTSNPLGASVSIDGTPDVCTTPCSEQLTVGMHNFVFTLAGYEDEMVSEDISSTNTSVFVTMTPLPVTVTVTSNPSGATVVIDDGAYTDTTSFTYDLLPGSHKFDFSLAGYMPQTINQDIDAANNTVHADLVADNTILVQINSDPQQAWVEIDSVPNVCQTPCEQSLTEGLHDFVFTVDTYDPVLVQESISAVNNSVFAVIDTVPTIEVTVVAVPSQTQVTIDDQYVDTSPFVIDLKEGMHHFVYEKPGYITQEYDENVDAANDYFFITLQAGK